MVKGVKTTAASFSPAPSVALAGTGKLHKAALSVGIERGAYALFAGADHQQEGEVIGTELVDWFQRQQIQTQPMCWYVLKQPRHDEIKLAPILSTSSRVS
jgi:hypothetical protein